MTQESSRRSFMKTSAGLAAGATVLSSLSAKAYAANDETLKIGLIGCGGRGSGAAAQALKTSGQVALVAMADMFGDRLESSLKRITNDVKGNDTATVDVPEERRYTGFDGYKQIMEDNDIDLVILATPPGFRPIHFEAAVNAGKHIFMEKPVATDAAGVAKVLESARKAKEKNLKVGVGLQRHHQLKYQDIIKRIQDDEIGDVVALRVYWNGGGVWDPRLAREDATSEMEYQLRNWYYYNWLCGDHICEQHIHNLDVGNWIKGSYPIRAEGMGGREVRTDKKYGEIYDHHAVEFTFDDGSKMFSQCRHIPNCWNSVSEWAHGTKGHANVSGASYELYDGKKQRYRGDNNDPYQTEHDDLFHAIRNNISYNEAEYGAMSTATSILGRIATYSGKSVNMSDMLASNFSIMPKEMAMNATPPTTPNENGEYPIPVPGVYKPY
ncbi:MAG: Gfo/Idh/MocA family oxidoreductase [Rubinisphaera brasiliensis]|uniref:Oxidoreductase domain protein n=1 Tax=Rubinisphaera brasiliensis (strain ATCC 49424 / DSM 5305 / JCM 21570 / IAM 15109 / NBRC 103401 / IFAM 1448) TaxID=756272 RepID=F0SPK5_RUBBR|nr:MULTISPECIES: Gfo/Idh/MocA family oxidoreductase [Rubinisphaera]ADY57909.1 oxidoreductase domain protein [Rubinisphaera brasiliensis DSM 5305]MBR9802284.1 Gfo/Idh/MocA family oxidoreductase [bacterium]